MTHDSSSVSSLPEADVAAVHGYCANKIPVEYPVAQLRFDPTDRRWVLYCADRNGRWHNYGDPTGIFWGQLVFFVLVGPVLVVPAVTVQQLAAARGTLGDVATEVVEAAGQDGAVAAASDRARPSPEPISSPERASE